MQRDASGIIAEVLLMDLAFSALAAAEAHTGDAVRARSLTARDSELLVRLANTSTSRVFLAVVPLTLESCDPATGERSPTYRGDEAPRIPGPYA